MHLNKKSNIFVSLIYRSDFHASPRLLLRSGCHSLPQRDTLPFTHSVWNRCVRWSRNPRGVMSLSGVDTPWCKFFLIPSFQDSTHSDHLSQCPVPHDLVVTYAKAYQRGSLRGSQHMWLGKTTPGIGTLSLPFAPREQQLGAHADSIRNCFFSFNQTHSS